MNNEWMDKIDNKLDSIADEITRVRIEQAKQHVTLKDHTRRSLASETRIEIVENIITKHLARLHGAAWVISALATLLGLYLAIWR